MNSELNKMDFVFDDVWERVSKLTGWKNYGQMASYLEITPSSVSGAKKRGYISLEWVFKVAQGFNSSTDWLATGKSDMKRGKTDYPLAEGLKTADMTGELGEGFVHVPRYKVSASAGGGALIHSEQIVDHLAFRADWVKMALGVPVSCLALINVTGDSMEPTLSNGDLILIDTSVDSVDDSGVYVLRFDGKLKVKRLHSKADSVDILSDNPRYPTETLRGDLLHGLNVVGRVVWCGRRM